MQEAYCVPRFTATDRAVYVSRLPARSAPDDLHETGLPECPRG